MKSTESYNYGCKACDLTFAVPQTCTKEVSCPNCQQKTIFAGEGLIIST